MADLFNEVSRKISIDQRIVSLNALEFFTREKGLEQALTGLVEDVINKLKAQRSILLNDTIVKELMDVKAMLESKSKHVA